MIYWSNGNKDKKPDVNPTSLLSWKFRKWNLEKYMWTMLCLPSFSLTRSFKDCKLWNMRRTYAPDSRLRFIICFWKYFWKGFPRVTGLWLWHSHMPDQHRSSTDTQPLIPLSHSHRGWKIASEPWRMTLDCGRKPEQGRCRSRDLFWVILMWYCHLVDERKN